MEPVWRERRVARHGSRSPLVNGALRARERAVRRERAVVNFPNFFSQLSPRHAFQVSIVKERANPRPLKRNTYHRYTGGSGPGERLASAIYSRLPLNLSLWPETALNYEMCWGSVT